MQKDPDPFRPFDDSDRTVFVPTPGGRRRGGADAESPSPVPRAPTKAALPEGVGGNPLLRAGASLFALVRQLRNTRRHDDVAALRRDVIAAVQAFDVAARTEGVDAKTAAQAGYAVCALIDETVLGTPWGLNSLWSQQSLSITFYKENVAGKQLFGYLEKARELPGQQLDLLEFIYVCLSLGFEGRFRLEPGGLDRLSRIRQDLYTVIRRERGELRRDFSPRWRGVQDRGPGFSRYVPIWVAGVAAAALAMLLLLGLQYRLNEPSDRVYAQIAALVPQTPALLPTVIPPKVEGLVARLRTTLALEIRQGLVDVRDQGDAGRIILFNRGLFPSGGAEIGQSFVPVVKNVGSFIADNHLRGPFTITGHTDNVPIHSLRFPSNWHLSEARAEAVATVLRSDVDAQALRVVGRADSEPLVSNDTPDGRAQNRRVEIRMPVTERLAEVRPQ